MFTPTHRRHRTILTISRGRQRRTGAAGFAVLVVGVVGVGAGLAVESQAQAQAEQGAAGAVGGVEALDDLDLVRLLNVEVSTASKTAESLDEAPAVIKVVTRADIARWGYQTVAEILTHTLGFYLIDDHILPNAGVRGMTGGLGAESGVIKVMIDGRSVAYRTTSGNWLGVELVPLEAVAQIEIIRGPASALYGADAFLGVVNIITMRPAELRPIRARAALVSTNQHPGGRFDAAGGAEVGRLHFWLGAAGEMTDRSGLALPPESPAPILPVELGARRTALNLSRRSLSLESRVGLTDADLGHVVLGASLSGLKRGGDFAHLAQLTNGSDAEGSVMGTVVALGQLRATVDGLLHLSRHLDVSLAGSYFHGGVLPSDRIETGSDLYYVKRRQSYQGFDSTTETRWIPTPRFNLIVGAEAISDRELLGAPRRYDRANGQLIEDAGTADTRVSLFNLGAYASSSFKVGDRLKLTGGLRYDNHSEYGGQLTGRVGLTSRLAPSLVGKLLYGTAFKAPSPYLLFATPLRPGDVVGNPALRPQRIHTVEYQMSWHARRWVSLLSGVSYNWLLDKAEFTPQGINQTARNVASQRTFTWETRANFRHHEDVNAYASFELVYSLRDLGQEGYAATLIGTKNVVYPPWIGRAGVSAALPSPRRLPLAAGAEALVVGPRRAADTSLVEHGGDFYFPTYAWLDAFVTTRDLYLVRGHETRVAIRGRNLLGARGPDPGFSGFEYPLAPTEIFLELHHTY